MAEELEKEEEKDAGKTSLFTSNDGYYCVNDDIYHYIPLEIFLQLNNPEIVKKAENLLNFNQTYPVTLFASIDWESKTNKHYLNEFLLSPVQQVENSCYVFCVANLYVFCIIFGGFWEKYFPELEVNRGTIARYTRSLALKLFGAQSCRHGQEKIFLNIDFAEANDSDIILALTLEKFIGICNFPITVSTANFSTNEGQEFFKAIGYGIAKIGIPKAFQELDLQAGMKITGEEKEFRDYLSEDGKYIDGDKLGKDGVGHGVCIIVSNNNILVKNTWADWQYFIVPMESPFGRLIIGTISYIPLIDLMKKHEKDIFLDKNSTFMINYEVILANKKALASNLVKINDSKDKNFSKDRKTGDNGFATHMEMRNRSIELVKKLKQMQKI